MDIKLSSWNLEKDIQVDYPLFPELTSEEFIKLHSLFFIEFKNLIDEQKLYPVQDFFIYELKVEHLFYDMKSLNVHFWFEFHTVIIVYNNDADSNLEKSVIDSLNNWAYLIKMIDNPPLKF